MTDLVHIVVYIDNAEQKIVCHTHGSQPAVYADASTAELRAAELRAHRPEVRYVVVSCPVL